MLTQAEWAKLYPDPLQSGVVELIVEVNPIMQYMPWQNIAGAAYVYNREQTLPGIAFRGINDSYTESTGVVNRLAEPLKIMGGDLDVDRALISWSTNVNDTRAIEDAMKIKSLSLTHLKTVFDGDSGTDPNEFDGLNVRLTGDQVIEAGADGAPLTLAMLDDLVDAVQGSPSLLVMNKKCRQLVRQAARSVPGFTISKDDLGREVDQYYGVPIAYTEFDAAGNPILGFDETVGTANDTASIYALSFGPGKMFGAQTSPISARDLGELESKPAYRTRVEHYGTIVLQHPRCAARLKGVTLHQALSLVPPRSPGSLPAGCRGGPCQGAREARAGAQDGKCALLKNNTVSRQRLTPIRARGRHAFQMRGLSDYRRYPADRRH